MSQNLSREEFDQRLAERDLIGLWKVVEHDEPSPKIEPCLWQWDDVYSALQGAESVIALEDEPQGSRRSVCLRNPVFETGNWASKTMTVGIQSVKPDEVARAHRHNIDAFRFVLEGQEEAYTTVEGERLRMGRGDLILTPSMTWHDHENFSEEPVVWLDGLPGPVFKFLNVPEFEDYPEDRQETTRADDYSLSRWGKLRPVESERTPRTPPYRYRWEDAERALDALTAEGECFDACDGNLLEYVDPVTGGPTLPTLSLRLQRLPGGEPLDTHRHSSTELFHAFEGSGRTTIGDETYEWSVGDSFVVPPNEWHAHEAVEDDAVLFTMSDRPLLEKLNPDTYRVETT